MESENTRVPSSGTSAILAALASRRRRVVLTALEKELSPVSVAELADRVADSQGTGDDVDETRRKRERVALVHRDLPKLADAALLEWRREDGMVATSDTGALTDSNVQRILDSSDEEWDGLLESLAHERRRMILAILGTQDQPICRRTLARRTVAREHNTTVADVSTDAVDAVLATLHHVHLPKLRRAGLLVDDDREDVQYAGDRMLDEQSFLIDSCVRTGETSLVRQ